MNTLADLAGLYQKFRDEPAFVYHRGYRTPRWTYRQTAELAFRFARELQNRDINKGDRVMLWGANSPEWVAAFLGCLLRGVVVVPMDRIAAPDFIERVAADVQAKLVVCSAALAQSADLWPRLHLEELAEAVAGHSGEPFAPVGISREATAEIVFTSGTTAEPRGVVLTHRNLLASLDPIEREISKYLKYERVFHPIRFLNLLPLSHVFGQYMAMFIPPLIGGTVIFQDSLNPRAVIAAIKRERISALVAVPRVAESLKARIERDFSDQMGQRFAAAENEKFLWRWWRFRKIHRLFGWKFWALISGGAALDAVTEEFWRRLGYVVIQGYGLTETSSLISLNHPFKVGRRSIGKLLPGREMRLDPKTGEILVRGENVAQQYWQGRQMKPVADEEGWFQTGDLGAVDEEGNLYFKGRNKNVIVTPAGLKIYPEDLEPALRRQPEVRDVVVLGVARGGNAEACAVLLLQDSASAERVVARANQTLADFQKIRCWLVWRDEDFPRTSTQKPRLDVIRQVTENQLDGKASAGAPAAGTLQQLIQGVSGRRVELRPGSHLEDDLNLNSLDRVELLSAIEDRYQVDLRDRDFSRVNTVADLEELIKESSSRPKPVNYPYSPWVLRWPVTWIRLLIYYLLVWPASMILAKPKIMGRERLRNFRGRALVISNHVSRVDIGFILAALPPRLRHRLATAMSGEMLREMRHPPPAWFFLRRWYSRLCYVLVTALFNVFSLPQKAAYQESFQYAGRLADRGYNILIFPEGQRTQTGAMAEFRKGIGLLATKLNLPVIPMRIDGLFPLKQKKKRFAKPGTVKVRIGEPVRFESSEDPEEIAKRLQIMVERL